MAAGSILALNPKPGHDFGKIRVNAGPGFRSSPVMILPKLEIGRVDSMHEREADHMADRVVRTASAPRSAEFGDPAPVTTFQPAGRAGIPAPPVLSAQLALRGRSGAPLAPDVRREMEGAFAFDFSRVRIHSDERAARMASSIRASAFTHGNDIFFNQRQYAPEGAAGKRLLAHELTHVVQKTVHSSAPGLQRQAMSRDWQYEADRMSTTELENEIQNLHAQLNEFNETNEESEELMEGIVILERTLMGRHRGRIDFEEGVLAVRRGHRRVAEESGAGGALVVAVLPQSAQAIFTQGFVTGFVTEIPPGEVQDALQELNEHPLEFAGGYYVGLPVGLWHGLTGLVEGIWMLAQMAERLTPTGMMRYFSAQALEFARDPQAYTEARRREYRQLRAVARALQEFGREFEEDPTIVMQWSGDLGLAIGEHMGGRFTEGFLRRSPYDKGYMVGDVVGMILFEVLLEIILAVATEGIGNLLRGVAAVGQGARAGGRLARVLRGLLESSPAIRRLLRALNGGEDVADVARATERIADVARAEDVADVGRTTERVGDVAEDVSSVPARERGADVVDLDEYRRRRAAEGPASEPAVAERPVEIPEEEELPLAVGDLPRSRTVVDPDRPRAMAGEGGGAAGGRGGPPRLTVVGPEGPPRRVTGSSSRPITTEEPDLVDIFESGRPSRSPRDLPLEEVEDLPAGPRETPHTPLAEEPGGEVIEFPAATSRRAGVGLAESHHIATRYEQQFERILSSVDIDIDSPLNRILLEEHGQLRGWYRYDPATRRYRYEMRGHHPDYHAWVLQNLRTARGRGRPTPRGRARVESALRQMETIVENNPEILQYGPDIFANRPDLLTITF